MSFAATVGGKSFAFDAEFETAWASSGACPIRETGRRTCVRIAASRRGGVVPWRDGVE
jgi:hypothetical protein